MSKEIRLDHIPADRKPTIGPMKFCDAATVEIEGREKPLDLREVGEETAVGDFVVRKHKDGFLIVVGPKATYYLRFEAKYGCWYYGREKN